jgi:hypothetical protein
MQVDRDRVLRGPRAHAGKIATSGTRPASINVTGCAYAAAPISAQTIDAVSPL